MRREHFPSQSEKEVYLRCFELFRLIHELTTDVETVDRITREVISFGRIKVLKVIEDFANENVKYLELRTTPRAIDGVMTKKKLN